jgi:hypothetical protein
MGLYCRLGFISSTIEATLSNVHKSKLLRTNGTINLSAIDRAAL